jgi:uncharacterized protein (TIGR00369 family)
VSPRLEVLESIIADGLALTPVQRTFAVRLTGAEHGRCVAEMPAALLGDPDEGGGAGALLVQADAVLGIAISSTLPVHLGVTTLSLDLRLVARHWPAEGEVRAEAGAVAVDDRTGVSSGEARAADGTLLATFGTRCAVIEAPEHWLHRRRGSGHARGSTPAAPVRLDARVSAGAERAELRAEPGPESANARGALLGGVLAMLADRVLVPLLGSPGGPEPVPHDLQVHYLRGTRPGPVSGDAEPVHPGRRLRTANAVLRDGDGRTLLTATGLAYRA